MLTALIRGRRDIAAQLEQRIHELLLNAHRGDHTHYVSRIESGSRRPSMRTPEALAARLDVDPIVLVAGP